MHLPGANSVSWQVATHACVYADKINCIDQNIEYFKAGCINREVNYQLHRNRGVPFNELVEESRFADLMVLDAEISFKKDYEGMPSTFAKDVLKNSYCPVIIAPDNFDAIDEIVFTYDGSHSSLFAIKQFTYLFPQLYNKKVSILQMSEKGEWHNPDKLKLKEWLKEHYTDLHFESIRGSNDIDLFEHLFQRKNMFLVMGAYSRNTLSQFFKRSHADILIKTMMQPIFIAHP